MKISWAPEESFSNCILYEKKGARWTAVTDDLKGSKVYLSHAIRQEQ